MLFGKPHSFLGVDLGAGGVKIVELKSVKNRPVLFTYAATADEQDVHRLLAGLPEAPVTPASPKDALTLANVAGVPTVVSAEERVAEYAAVLKAVCKQARTISKAAVVSLPVSAVFHAVVTLPAAKKEEFDHLLKAEVKKLLPYSLDEAVLDYQILPNPTDGSARRVLVNAVPRSLVVFYTRVFQAAGLMLEALEPESLALARCLVGRDQSLCMIVDIGAERTNFFIIDGGLPITHHSIEIGGKRITGILAALWKTTPALTESLKQDLFNELQRAPEAVPLTRERLAQLLNPLIDPILKEIQYGFEIYLRQSGSAEGQKPEKVILTGGGAHFPFLADTIAQTFKLKCYVGDPWGRVVYADRLKPALSAIGSRLSVAIGLALRSMV